MYAYRKSELTWILIRRSSLQEGWSNLSEVVWSGPGVPLSVNKSDTINSHFIFWFDRTHPWTVRFPCWCSDLQNKRAFTDPESYSPSLAKSQTLPLQESKLLLVFCFFRSKRCLFATLLICYSCEPIVLTPHRVHLRWAEWRHQSRRMLWIHASCIICIFKRPLPSRFLRRRDTFALFSTTSDVYAAQMRLEEWRPRFGSL